MRTIISAALTATLAMWLVTPVAAQTSAPIQLAPPAPAADIRIEWEVKNRFRLFKRDEDFQRHVSAHRADGVLAAERRLERAADGRGWSRDQVDRLCIDQSGRIPEYCERDGQREVYLAPQDHNVAVAVAGNVPSGATCAWIFEEGDGAPRQTSNPCEEEIRIRLHYGRPTIARVTITQPDGSARTADAEILVRDLLIAGLGDSIAAGEGNPDRPIALDDGGFCFRRFLGGSFSEYFRPGRAGFRGNKACDPSLSTGPTGYSG
jgi:hypothetical protein